MPLPRSLCAALLVGAAILVATPARAADSSRLPVSPVEVARLACTAHVRTGTLSCAPLAALPSVRGEVSLSVQSARVALGAWTLDVAVRNAAAQVLGAPEADGPAPGVQVRMSGTPTLTAGIGSVHADATAFQYDGVLAPGQTSAAQPWAFRVSPLVESFTFSASVLATVAPPRGFVTLTAPSLFALQGSTVAFTATARTATGVLMPGAFLSWLSSDPAIAPVSQTGVVTAATPGAVTITASSGGSVGTAPICVAPNLAVGGVYHYVLGAGARFCLPGGAAGNAEYTIMPTNQSSTTAVTLTTLGTGVVAVTGPPSPRPGPATALAADGAAGDPVDAEALAASDAAELARVTQDRAETTPLLRNADSRIGASGGTDDAIPPGVPTVGASWSLNVAQGCAGAVDNRTGVVRAVSAHAIIVEDTNNPNLLPYSSGTTTVTADTLANRFERIVWPTITTAFGQPTDLDNNGRIVLFYTRAVNELSPPATAQAVNGYGYFTNRDLFSTDPTSGCARSNAGEIMYMLVPDVSGTVNSNVRTVSLVEGSTTRQAGHELVRLINASRRLYVVGASSFEEPWLDLGLAAIGEELMFYRTGPGLAPRQNITLQTLTTGSTASQRVAAFNTYANQNFGRYRSFLQRPDIRYPFTEPTSTTQLDIDGNQGATWAFLRYAADRRNGDDNTFWSSMIGTSAGLGSIQQALGLATQADVLTWFRDWNVAAYADDAVTNISATYQTTSWNYRSVFGGLGGVPILARPLTAGTGLTISYARGGSTSFLRAGVPTGAFATFDLSGAFSGTLPVSVVRTK